MRPPELAATRSGRTGSPLYGALRRFVEAASVMYVTWQTRHQPVSFDRLVGKLLELRWHIKAECRGGLQIDYEIELLRPLYRQVTWLGTLQDLRNVTAAGKARLSSSSLRINGMHLERLPAIPG